MNSVTFFHSRSIGINFCTVSHVRDCSLKTIVSKLTSIRKLYESRGFRLVEIQGDGGFKGLEAEISPINLNTVPQDEHVPEVEQSIRTVKESMRTITHGLPFCCLPKVMLLELLYFVVRNLNLYSSESSVSTTLSPLSTVRGEGPADLNSFGLEFGSLLRYTMTEHPPTRWQLGQQMPLLCVL